MLPHHNVSVMCELLEGDKVIWPGATGKAATNTQGKVKFLILGRVFGQPLTTLAKPNKTLLTRTIGWQ